MKALVTQSRRRSDGPYDHLNETGIAEGYLSACEQENRELRAEISRALNEPTQNEHDLWAENKRLRLLLQRLYEWDHMDSAADGAFWRNEIDKALGKLGRWPV